MFKNLVSYQGFFLLGFVIFCVLGSWSILDEDMFLDIAFKIIRFTFLLLFYIASSKKVNTLFIISMGLFVVSSAFFSVSPSSVEAIAFLGFSRIPLIKILWADMKKEHWKSFKIVFLFFLTVLILMLPLLYKNSLFFYISIFSSLLLVVLIALSSSLVLRKINKQHIEMFIGVFLFVLTDAVFGSQKIGETNTTYLLLAALLYNVANYLITMSIIKRDTQ